MRQTIILSLLVFVISCSCNAVTEEENKSKSNTPETEFIGIHPNPFNSDTKIDINLVERKYVELAVYDMLGRKTTELHQGMLEKGVHRFTFEGLSLSSGTYSKNVGWGEYPY